MAVLPRPAKVFLASHRDGVGMCFNILIPPPPSPLCIDKGYTCKFSIL